MTQAGDDALNRAVVTRPPVWPPPPPVRERPILNYRHTCPDVYPNGAVVDRGYVLHQEAGEPLEALGCDVWSPRAFQSDMSNPCPFPRNFITCPDTPELRALYDANNRYEGIGAVTGTSLEPNACAKDLLTAGRGRVYVFYEARIACANCQAGCMRADW